MCIRFRVWVQDGRIFQAEIRGLDTMKDLAVLKIKASDLPVPEMAKDNDLKIGQMLLLIPATAEVR